MLASPAAAHCVYVTIRTMCPEVWTLNGEHYTDMSSCIDHRTNNPTHDQNNVWFRRSRACRNLHVVFVNTNPRHCAHLSREPMADPNGAFKCQDEKVGGPSYYPAHYCSAVGHQYGLYTGEAGGTVPLHDVVSAFDPITNTTNANDAFGWRTNVYSKVLMLLLWLAW